MAIDVVEVQVPGPQGPPGESASPPATNYSHNRVLSPRSSQFSATSGNIMASHWNPERFQVDSLSLQQRSGNLEAKYRFVIYAPNGGLQLYLVYTSPEFSSISTGESGVTFTTPGLIVPKGTIFVQLFLMSGTSGIWNSGVPDQTYGVNRDINNNGGAVVDFSNFSDGWGPPATVNISQVLGAPAMPFVVMNGVTFL